MHLVGVSSQLSKSTHHRHPEPPPTSSHVRQACTTHHLHRAPLGILSDPTSQNRQLRTAKAQGANSRSTEHVLQEPTLSPTPATPGPQRTSKTQPQPIKEALPTYGSPPPPPRRDDPKSGLPGSPFGSVYFPMGTPPSPLGTHRWGVYTPPRRPES